LPRLFVSDFFSGSSLPPHAEAVRPKEDNYIENAVDIGHIRTMLKTSPELIQDIADRIRVRRLALDLSQQEAAQRSGVAYRTWRRLETEGKASIEYLVKAAIALRCEEALEGLFPAPVATSLDDLLKREAKGAGVASPRRSRAKGRGGSPS
jgi:transcriptional regulator with XRE-family HTH domain